MSKRIFLLDNYDSFTYNLSDYIRRCNAKCIVLRNDEITVEEIENEKYDGIVLSPGPKRPRDAGILNELVHACIGKGVPTLGVCLGHQALGEYFGLSLVKAEVPMHGKTSLITHDNIGIYTGLQSPLEVMRYHSLLLTGQHPALEVSAFTDKKEIMSFRHKKLPICGVQYHPESILTQGGTDIISNWIKSIT